MDDERISRLEAQVEELARALRRLESQSALHAGSVAPAAPVAEPALEPADELVAVAAQVSQAGVVALLGRSFLALGGAFLIRALTDAQLLPPAAGTGLGLGFALLLLVLADRALGVGARPSAAFHAGTGALIAHPLIWESAARLHLLPGPAAAGALALYALATLVVARRRSSQGLAWLATAAGLATALGLMATTDALGALTAGLLALFAATLWLALDRGWPGLRWPVGLLLEVTLLRLAGTLAGAGGLDIGRETGAVLALLLPILIGASLAAQRLSAARPPGPFDWSLAPLGLAIGLYASAEAAGPGGRWLVGALALLLGIGAYAAAFAGAGARRADPIAAHFFALLGFGLAIAGSELLGGGAAAAALWSAAGLAAVLLAPRSSGAALAVQGAALLWAGALRSGLLGFAGSAFAGDGATPFASLGLAAGFALACAAAAASVALARAAPESDVVRGVRAAIAALVALSLAALLAALGAGLLGPGSPAGLATLRTAVLAACALGLAALARALRARELAWLCYGALALGGVKLALQDLPSGRALTLVAAFAIYGLALILAPRLARVGPLRG